MYGCNPGYPFCTGVTLAKLAAVTMDEQGNETFDTSGALDKLRKLVQLDRLAMYHDSNTLPWSLDKKWEDLSPKDWIECLYTIVRELVENSLDSAESISELPVVEITIEEILKTKFNSMIDLVDRELVDEELYDDYETAKACEKRLAKEARAQEIQAKNAALGKKGREPAASKGMKGRGEASFYRVTCKDNRRGMPHEDIPNMFGRVLSGTKYGLKQTRGKFGLGAKMVVFKYVENNGDVEGVGRRKEF